MLWIVSNSHQLWFTTAVPLEDPVQQHFQVSNSRIKIHVTGHWLLGSWNIKECQILDLTIYQQTWACYLDFRNKMSYITAPGQTAGYISQPRQLYSSLYPVQCAHYNTYFAAVSSSSCNESSYYSVFLVGKKRKQPRGKTDSSCNWELFCQHQLC